MLTTARLDSRKDRPARREPSLRISMQARRVYYHQDASAGSRSHTAAHLLFPRVHERLSAYCMLGTTVSGLSLITSFGSCCSEAFRLMLTAGIKLTKYPLRRP